MITLIERPAPNIVTTITHRKTTVVVPSTPDAGRISVTTIGRRGPAGLADAETLDYLETIALAGL
jgi:hypothetical protein